MAKSVGGHQSGMGAVFAVVFGNCSRCIGTSAGPVQLWSENAVWISTPCSACVALSFWVVAGEA